MTFLIITWYLYRGKMEGRKLGKYHIERFIGQGSMGAVYKARDLVKEEDVAIKIVESKGWKKDKKVQHFSYSITHI